MGARAIIINELGSQQVSGRPSRLDRHGALLMLVFTLEKESWRRQCSCGLAWGQLKREWAATSAAAGQVF